MISTAARTIGGERHRPRAQLDRTITTTDEQPRFIEACSGFTLVQARRFVDLLLERDSFLWGLCLSSGCEILDDDARLTAFARRIDALIASWLFLTPGAWRLASE